MPRQLNGAQAQVIQSPQSGRHSLQVEVDFLRVLAAQLEGAIYCTLVKTLWSASAFKWAARLAARKLQRKLQTAHRRLSALQRRLLQRTFSAAADCLRPSSAARHCTAALHATLRRLHRNANGQKAIRLAKHFADFSRLKFLMGRHHLIIINIIMTA